VVTSRSLPCIPGQLSLMHCHTGSQWSCLSTGLLDVLAPASANDEVCGSIFDSLKMLNQAVGNVGQQ